MAHAGFTLWLTGLSGAGKSTLAEAVRHALRSDGTPVDVLDGDEVRRNLSPDLGFSKEDRDRHVRRIGYVARLLSRNGVVALVAAISPYSAIRDEVRRAHEARFVEVFVSCAIEELIRRDRKGLYATALRGEVRHFTGISDPYEAPAAPEITVFTDREDVQGSVTRILDWLRHEGLLGRPR